MSSEAIVNSDFAVEELTRLVSHAPVSSSESGKSVSNKAIIDYIEGRIKASGIDCTVMRSTNVPSGETDEAGRERYERFGEQHTMVVRFGPDVEGGVLLSTHTDVQPVVKPEDWAGDEPLAGGVQPVAGKGPQPDPFRVKAVPVADGEVRLVGRGTTDMLGFCTNMIRVAHMLKGVALKKPVYLAFSWGEEVGCAGMPDMMALLKQHNIRPNVNVIGEGTGNKLITAHKGGQMIHVTLHGIGGHSSLPQTKVDPLRFGMRIQQFFMKLEQKLQSDKYRDDRFDPPYPVVCLGKVEAGSGGNTVAEKAYYGIHIRPTPAMDADAMQQEVFAPLQKLVAKIEREMKNLAKQRGLDEARCRVECRIPSPTLAFSYADDPEISARVKEAYARVHDASAADVKTGTVAFASEAGFFEKHARDSGVPHMTVVWHPNLLEEYNAHKANEFIPRADLYDGIRFPLALINEFCIGKERAPEKPGDTVLLTEAPKAIAIPPAAKERAIA